jgi:type III pantothenate kinase
MLATFDVGNTAVKLAIFDGDEIIARWRFRTNTASTPVDYWMRFRNVLLASELPAASVTEAAIVSVVPDLTPVVHDACVQFFRCEPFVFETGTAVPIESRYDAALGADRLMNAVAAVAHYGPGPLVVVDLGTAVKFEAIDAAGIHLGGAISPGITIATDELFARSAMVARSLVEPPERVVGRSTPAAVDAGVFLGYAGMVSGMVQRFRGELGAPDARVIATGGWAKALAAECSFDVIDGDLTVKGLRAVWLGHR